MVYIFLSDVKSNYQLYDIEAFPRSYPYLIMEKATINDITYSKLRCDEDNISFYIFNINGNNYVESNYDDTTIEKVSNNRFKVKYGNITNMLDIKKNTYTIGKSVINCKILY